MQGARMRRARGLVAIPLALVLSLGVSSGLTGCSFQTAVKNLTGGGVDIGGNKVPADFPSAVPLYKGDVVFGASVGSTAKKLWNVTIKVPGKAATDAIAKQLTGAGFHGQFDTRSVDAGTGSFTDGTYEVVVVVTDAGNNGWVANYTVASGGSPTPTATP